jgi:hypothetical protein
MTDRRARLAATRSELLPLIPRTRSEPALEAALARIEALGNAPRPQVNPILADLYAQQRKLDSFSDGMDGGRQVFAALFCPTPQMLAIKTAIRERKAEIAREDHQPIHRRPSPMSAFERNRP